MNDDTQLELPERSAEQAPKANLGLILAAAIAIGLFPLIFGIYGWRVAGQGDQPLVTERTEWPALLTASFDGSPLTDEDLETIELTPLADGWFLRMKATPTAVEYVTTTLSPLDEAAASEASAVATKQFWENMPHRWRNHKPSANDRFYATRDGEWLARINDEDKVVLLWSGSQKK
ncbi:hypothetical protein [Lacipirellula parvula]|uniref:Uncharacterized protein n=1 Tax=Lacipirellula parvula TaxID=2650471 RepID=A0A5K7XIE3_9BACT|nr:hypothetical protein [Lacipirellula parvula]BBO36218.1 hypothetical protein PLANPX_5830 [Lacipirellula parvula]